MKNENKIMTHEAAWYILDTNGWNHRDGGEGKEYIFSMAHDSDVNNIAEYNRFDRHIKIHPEIHLHVQELLAILTIFRII